MADHYDLPPVRNPLTGAFSVVDQDTPYDIRNCAAACLIFPLGYREDQADFGTPTAALRARTTDEIDLEDVRDELTRWDDRFDDHVEQNPDDLDELVQDVLVPVDD